MLLVMTLLLMDFSMQLQTNDGENEDLLETGAVYVPGDLGA